MAYRAKSKQIQYVVKPSGGVTPEGKKVITNTLETDVSAYATAQVVDANLIAENIKKGVTILGITGTYEGESATFTLEVSASSMMEGYGSLDIQYNNQDVSYWDGTELTPPDTNLTLNFVEGAQMVVTYNPRYGYCRIYRNGTLIHDTAGSPYTFTPNLNDTIKVEFYWED